MNFEKIVLLVIAITLSVASIGCASAPTIRADKDTVGNMQWFQREQHAALTKLPLQEKEVKHFIGARLLSGYRADLRSVRPSKVGTPNLHFTGYAQASDRKDVCYQFVMTLESTKDIVTHVPCERILEQTADARLSSAKAPAETGLL